MTPPIVELIALARNPVPSSAVVGMFEGFDSKLLRYARWQPTRPPQRGTVCIFPGRSEYIERYFEVTADLQRRGFAVAIMDWRGQGGSVRELSNPRKGHIRDFDDYERDLGCFMQTVVMPNCPRPYIAYAHSMGGTILARHAARPNPWFERIVLTAPMFQFHPDRVGVPAAAARAYATMGRACGFGQAYVMGGSDEFAEGSVFEGNPLTSDRNRFERNAALAAAAPHLTIGSATIGWLRAAYKAMDVLNQPDFPATVKVPMLLFVAGADTIVWPRAIEDFAARLKVGRDVVIATSRHEIPQETDDIRARFWAALDAYLGVQSRAA